MIRSDTSIVLNDILNRLCEIRDLLEWDKNDTLKMRAEGEARKEQDMAEIKAWQDRMGEITFQKSLEAQRQAYAEHEQRYHSRGGNLSA